MKTAQSEKGCLENELGMYKKALGELETRFKIVEG